jgi:hypothetical protein
MAEIIGAFIGDLWSACSGPSLKPIRHIIVEATSYHCGGAEPSMPAAKASVAADENAVL